MPHSQRQGYTMQVLVDAETELCVKRISATDQVQELDITSSCADRANNNDVGASGLDVTPVAFENVLPGLRKLTVTIEGDYDADGAGDPPSFQAGDWVKLNTLQLGYSYNNAIFLCAQFDMTSEVRGLIGYSCRLVSDGSFTRSAS